MRRVADILRAHSMPTLTAALVAAVTAGCASSSLRDSIAQGKSGGSSAVAFRSGVNKLPPLKALAASHEVQAFARNHPSGCDCSFALPSEDEPEPVEPFPRQALVGNWSAVYYCFERTYETGAREKTNFHVTKAEERYSFGNDGTYRLTIFANGKVYRTISGRWTYSNGLLDLTSSKDKNWHGEYRIDWFGCDDMAIRCRTNDVGANMIMAQQTSKFPDSRYKSDCKFWYDGTGCQRVIREHISDGHAVHGDAIETPHRFCRGNSAASQKSAAWKTQGKPYSIISCERENGSDFAYRFVLELADGADAGLDAFRAAQQDFRNAVREDYAEAFALDSADGLYVDFPEFALRGGRIEGRAVVLTIKVVSLVYNPHTRKGALAVRVAANQFEDARQYVRRNIETLARDKNIALVTGEVPEKATFYLGREEIKDGDILEIEFKTE